MPYRGIYYAIHPGSIRSEEDGQRHFIGVPDLLRIYGLQKYEAIVWDEISDPNISEKVKYNDLIHLYPRNDGKYFKIPRTPEHQMELWIRGISMHSVGNGLDKCCPDFSCCYPLTEDTPEKVKLRFREAYREKDAIAINSMINMFITNSYLNTDPEKIVKILEQENEKIH